MKSASKFLWNLFRLVLALGFFGLGIAAVVFVVRGQYRIAAGMAAAMSGLFFSINVTNFWQYRWEEADTGARVVVAAPIVLSVAAFVVSLFVSAPIGFSAVGVVIVFWLTVTRRRPDLRFRQVPVRLQLDEDEIRLMYAGFSLDSIGWNEIARVAATPDAEGPVDDELFFLLEDDAGERCVVPNAYAHELLERLQRLEDFDNEGLVEAATAGGDEPRVLWEGNPGRAAICGRDGE